MNEKQVLLDINYWIDDLPYQYVLFEPESYKNMARNVTTNSGNSVHWYPLGEDRSSIGIVEDYQPDRMKSIIKYFGLEMNPGQSKTIYDLKQLKIQLTRSTSLGLI